ncbi:MAG TPA: adenosylcobalamin-dependent ribonucleoside-diphosphate reductase [Phenylobacterium sp.]|nr:adenosylcobalamin-dependent ribonucleoside-diphosphate reductase [Phenylobacterium sp.]
MPGSPPNAEVAAFIWRTRYRAPGEATIADTWRRVARAVASVETEPGRWEKAFLEILEGFRFLPGGRILAGAGTDRASLNNCFVMGQPEDSTEGVFRALREAVATLRAGGGIGCDFSPLSPRGAITADGAVAPGPVAFLALWDAACETFLTGSPRGGAMMGTLSCDHPDIEDFIAAKRRPGALRRFNLSVLVTDAFMAAVKDAADWPLVHGGRTVRTVAARTLWEALARSAYDSGEPGVLFVDRINRTNNLWWRERITAANPCGEIPLPAHGACDLGSLNLVAFVRDAFTPGARLDFEHLGATARTAVRFLDDVIDLTAYPLAQQGEVARGARRIGLGVTGLADALVMLGMTYGEAPSLDLAAQALRTIRDAAYRASVDLAREKGAFPAFDRDRYLKAPFVRRLPQDVLEGIAAFGVRNSHLLAIAPTGSISLLAGGVSTGVEPVFAGVQARTARGEDGSPVRLEVTDPALALWRARTGSGGEPPGFVTAQAVPVTAHLDMQAALQPFVDNAISKTINVAADCPFEQFRPIFDMAYERGLKGCAAFRPTPVRPPVLEAQDEASASPCHLGGTVCD